MAESPGRFDFETLKELAERDPAAFEALWRARIDAVIARAPQDRQIHLRRLQWRVEQARRRAENPLAACVALSRMMWEAFAGPAGLLDAMQMRRPQARVPAKVLAFRPNRLPRVAPGARSP